MFSLFDFYRRQIEDFNRTEADLDALLEEISNSDDISNEEYFSLYEIAVQKMQEV